MGVADYGIDPITNTAYTYNTTALLGTITLASLSANGLVSFQLNALLKFTCGATTFVYWLQNAIQLAPSSQTIDFVDNVWNMSAPGASMHTPVGGNGIVNPTSTPGIDYYYCQFGHYYTLAYPVVLQLEMMSSLNGNNPAITFGVDRGTGWVSYDTVVFPITGPAVDENLVVDGTQLTPTGNYYDAELVMGGVGNGASAAVNAVDMNLTLSTLNGALTQSVPFCYNFGSDTAELVTDIVTTLLTTPTGSYTVHLAAGAGGLGAWNVNCSATAPAGATIVTLTPLAFTPVWITVVEIMGETAGGIGGVVLALWLVKRHYTTQQCSASQSYSLLHRQCTASHMASIRFTVSKLKLQ
jgi:hypothetical protein